MKLPQIPSHWLWKTVGKLGAYGRPAVKAGPFGSALKKEFYVYSGFRVYGQEQVIAGDLSIGDYYIDKEKFDSLKACEVKAGDILISLVGTFGKVLVVPDVFEPGIINPRLVRLSLDPQLVDPYFFSRFFQSPLASYQMEMHSHGGTMDILNAKNISELVVPLPPIAEQRRIAAILDRADAVRRKRQEAIALTEELLRSAFLEMFGDPVTNPKRWRTHQLKSLVDSNRGISYGIVQRGSEVPGGVPVIRISNIASNKFIGEPIVRTAPEIAAQYQRTVLRGGELLISIRGTVGKVAIAPSDAKGWNVSREVAVIPLETDLSVHYLHCLLLSNGAQNYITDEVRGVAQKGINLRELSLLPVPIPPKELQEQWDKFMTKIHSSIKHIEEQFNESEYLFNSLLQKAFRGEL